MPRAWKTIVCLTALAIAVEAPAHAQQRAVLPMHDLAHLTVVNATINGRGPYQMVLDTGAGITVLHQDLAAHLGLPKVGTVEIGGPMQGSPILTDSVEVSTIGLGDVDFHDIAAVALDLDEVFRPLVAPDGILSVKSLRGHSITLDFPAKEVVIHRAPLVASDNVAILEYGAAEPVPSIPVKVGGVEVRADLDTGSPGLISMPLDYVDKLSLQGPPRKSGQGRTVDATFEIVSSRLDGNFELGQFALENPDNLVSQQRQPCGSWRATTQAIRCDVRQRPPVDCFRAGRERTRLIEGARRWTAQNGGGEEALRDRF